MKVVTLGVMLLMIAFPAVAQPLRTVRIGYLGKSSDLTAGEKDFVEELRRRGWIEGQNLVIERRYWENQIDRLPAQAADLVRLKVDIIVTNTGTAAQVAKKITDIIPIVMISSADAVTQGLAISLARPGGNVTGLTTVSPWVTGKQLELLKEAFPKASRVAVLSCVVSRAGLIGIGRGLGERQWNEAQDAARVPKIQLLRVLMRGPEETKSALEMVMRDRADALFVSDCVTVPAVEFIELAAKSRLPAIYPNRQFAERGGLMSYGADQSESYRRAAYFVDTILKGANPADLPVEQPTKFELVINLKTARQIGVTIPPEVLMWADEVIK
ncbi:MAG TPA: ABC transporter substrate-binding protein [Candidatus Binatia bacterium]|jgi:putative ABC transport system substrate-binding protein